jgi:hypothetical protein
MLDTSARLPLLLSLRRCRRERSIAGPRVSEERFAYRLPAEPFAPIGAPMPHAHVATEPVEPLGPAEPVGDLLRLHEAAGIQLRVVDNLWPFWDVVITSTLGFSGVRLRNAPPRPDRDQEPGTGVPSSPRPWSSESEP